MSSEPNNTNITQHPACHPQRSPILSSRELEVLRLVVSGLPMKSVARRLGIAPRTVAFHKYRAMRLLGLQGNADLIHYAIQHGLLGGNTFAPAFSAQDGD